MAVLENHPLAPHTTMNIGGNARYYVDTASIQDIQAALDLARRVSLPVFILGGGSNTLIADEGFEGCVIHPVMNDVQWETLENGEVRVHIEAGACFDDVVAESCLRNLGGIEALSGIPGNAGGSLVQNIGAYGQEFSEVFVSARAIHAESGEIIDLSRDDLQFAYRHTALKTPDNKLIVTQVTIRLTPFDIDAATERSISRGFQKLVQNRPKNAADLRKMIIETRRSKGMCYDENDVNTHSVGSFFVNPVVSSMEAQRLNSECIQRTNRPLPSYPAPDGRVKLSAAWLIEQSGFSKGYGFKGAALSAMHCLAIINRNQASCADVRALAAQIVKRVAQTFRVTLSPEVVYLDRRGILPLSNALS